MDVTCRFVSLHPDHIPLMFFGLLTGSHDRLSRRTPGRTPFHPCAVLPRPASRTHPLPATPFQWPRSRTATLGWEAAAPFLPSRRPDCTLSRLRAEEYDRPVTQSIATPEPSSRTIPHPGSDAGRPLEPWVCRHTREPTVLSRVSCRPFHLNIDRFHQPCLLPGRTSRMGEDCRPRTTWRASYPFWAARFFLLCVSLEVFATATRRYHGRMFIHPSPPYVCHPLQGVCTHARSGPSRVRRRL